MQYLFFDVETTGLPRNWKASVYDTNNWPRVVQLAWIVTDAEGREIRQQNAIIRPDGFTIPAQAAKVHGITTARARAEGLELGAVLDDFHKDLSDCTHVVAHNIDFDTKVLGAEFIRLTQATPLAGKTLVCTMKASAAFCALPGPYGYKWPSLAELHYRCFGHNFSEAHNALMDVRACRDCFLVLRERGVRLG